MSDYIIKDIDTAILRMNRKYLFLSNFYEGCKFTYKGLVFHNSESAFQGEKCPNILEDFTELKPMESKRLGRKVPLTPNWDNIKDQVMYNVCYAKFSQNKDLKEKLLATEDREIIEGNNHGDKYWGMIYIQKDKKWIGKNQLGITLMKIREELK